jgi:hypothetical protein
MCLIFLCAHSAECREYYYLSNDFNFGYFAEEKPIRSKTVLKYSNSYLDGKIFKWPLREGVFEIIVYKLYKNSNFERSQLEKLYLNRKGLISVKRLKFGRLEVVEARYEINRGEKAEFIQESAFIMYEKLYRLRFTCNSSDKLPLVFGKEVDKLKIYRPGRSPDEVELDSKGLIIEGLDRERLTSPWTIAMVNLILFGIRPIRRALFQRSLSLIPTDYQTTEIKDYILKEDSKLPLTLIPNNKKQIPWLSLILWLFTWHWGVVFISESEYFIGYRSIDDCMRYAMGVTIRDLIACIIPVFIFGSILNVVANRFIAILFIGTTFEGGAAWIKAMNNRFLANSSQYLGYQPSFRKDLLPYWNDATVLKSIETYLILGLFISLTFLYFERRQQMKSKLISLEK